VVVYGEIVDTNDKKQHSALEIKRRSEPSPAFCTFAGVPTRIFSFISSYLNPA
jgi:hypothetical protein